MTDAANSETTPDQQEPQDGSQALERSSFATVVSRIAHESVRSAPSLLPEHTWWNNLESNFHRRPEGFELPMRDAARVRAMVASDKLVRLGLSLLTTSLAVPAGYHPWRLRKAAKERQFYQRFADERDVDGFFQRPPRGITIQRKRRRVHLYGDSIVEDISFVSPFDGVHPAYRDEVRRQRRNRIARAKFIRHGDRPRPTVVFIHGFAADPYWLNEKVFAMPAFFEAGCDVLMFTLPYHGPRQERFSPFSGHGFFSRGISGVNEAFAQAVYDFRVLLDWLLHDVGAPEVGVTGISLGGYTSAILAAVEDRLAFSIPNVALASLPDLIMEWPLLSSLFRGAMIATGLNLRDARHMMAAHSPLTYAPRLPKERLMVIGGVGDRVVPPKHSRLIWEHWGRCRMHWFPGSHIIHLDQGEYIRQTFRFLDDIGFLPDTEQPDPAPANVLKLHAERITNS